MVFSTGLHCRLVELMQSAEMRVYARLGLKALPYALIFASKLFLQHALGLAALLLLALVQLFVNRILVHYVAQRVTPFTPSQGRLGSLGWRLQHSGRRYDLLKIVLTLCIWLPLFLTATAEEELWRV